MLAIGALVAYIAIGLTWDYVVENRKKAVKETGADA